MEKDEDKLPVAKIDNGFSSALSTDLTVDKEKLNRDTKEIIGKIVAEQDMDKQKDLTALFNANQNKKTVMRMDRLGGLIDTLIDQASRRFQEKPDEMSNQDLLNGLKITQDLIEKSRQQINAVNDEPVPLIQINQPDNSVHIDKDPISALNRDSREKVKDVVSQLLKSITNTNSVIDVSDNLSGHSVSEQVEKARAESEAKHEDIKESVDNDQ